MAPAQKAWNAAIQERVGVTSSVLGQMKEVKLLGLTRRWSHDIQALRVKELELNAGYRVFIVAMNVIGNKGLPYNLALVCSMNLCR
jgi:ATP-binding cassette, subfamily C (CFTR/MRP), member 1